MDPIDARKVILGFSLVKNWVECNSIKLEESVDTVIEDRKAPENK